MTDVGEHEAARRARSLAAHGFRRAAIDVLEAALLGEPDAGRLWAFRAVLLACDGRHDEAFDDIQRALALVPLGAGELLILAEGYARTGLTASAVDVYLELAADARRPHDLWPAIFAGLFRAKRWSAALAVGRRAAEQRPDDDGAYFAMAQALARLGRPAEMIVAVLAKAIDLNPVDPRYRVLLSMQLLRCGRQRDAFDAIAALPAESYGELACACCAWKLLRLCVTFGDEARAAHFGAQLARLATKAARGTQREGEQ
jgi:tetratricopeptide (TPR) repeat protein